jgi:hypothetical protein
VEIIGIGTMDVTEFERLNHLSEKSLNDNATLHEMKEFEQLHSKWNKSEEFNLFIPFD